ncbi:hypothetical protein BZG02_13755 [Labilibaculum filiforme]|uniref:Uncharacterized protein n=1 Tax=Labilibaculum filiforme TaxID=1940526 RepID=A0A2N3HVB5_9BACT|nr:DUF5808 domain-containing protein [Labilibaculum filiforme]PKQ62000.1 hypothetical protein BZG02_13755 [Labilibaculum filiforme]
MKKKLDQHILDTMSKDLANWHGPFYCNRKDSRLMVPKYDPMLGWTFNFASPYAFITIIVIVLLIVGSQILL